MNKVGNAEQWKAEGAMGLVMKGDKGLAIYGPKAEKFWNHINKISLIQEIIPETLFQAMTEAQNKTLFIKDLTQRKFTQ